MPETTTLEVGVAEAPSPGQVPQSFDTLDRRPGMHHRLIAGVFAAEQVTRAGLPADAEGKPLPANLHRGYGLQHGFIYDAQDRRIPEESVPNHIKAIRAHMQEHNPAPGVTHQGRVIECPFAGCRYATCMEAGFTEHVRTHDATDEQRREALRRGRQRPSRYSMADFADPQKVLARSEGPAGPGVEVEKPGEE